MGCAARAVAVQILKDKIKKEFGLLIDGYLTRLRHRRKRQVRRISAPTAHAAHPVLLFGSWRERRLGCEIVDSWTKDPG